MTNTTDDVKRDWRGTPIEVGQTVIYGAGVGRNIAMVEAEVEGFTDSGRVWLIVKHRAYGYTSSNSPRRVHVGPDRLTVVTKLPPTDLPTEAEKSEADRQNSLKRYREAIEAIDAGEPPRYALDRAWYERQIRLFEQ